MMYRCTLYRVYRISYTYFPIQLKEQKNKQISRHTRNAATLTNCLIILLLSHQFKQQNYYIGVMDDL